MKKKQGLIGLQKKRCKSRKINSMKKILCQINKKTLKRSRLKELTKRKVMNFESS